MGKWIDITNQEFTRLTALSYEGQGMWRCSCKCGGEVVTRGQSLREGLTQSCGCLAKEASVVNGKANATHGESGSHLHILWLAIKHRCFDPNQDNYKYYGGRGITIEYESWIKNYTSFRDWALINGYKHGLEIDRRDNSKGYSPENCRFVTKSVNQNNTRGNSMLEVWGESKSIANWSKDERCQPTYYGLYQRLRAGWDAVSALATPSSGSTSKLHLISMGYAQFWGMI